MLRAAPKRIEDDTMAHASPIASSPAFLDFDFDQIIGFALVAGLPALFWTAIICVAFASFGLALSLTATCATTAGIAAFLGIIFRALGRN